MRAVDAIMECLKAEGVEHVFGIPGGANLPTYDALYDAGIRHVQCRHEQGAGHAAEGYAKASGKVGRGARDERSRRHQPRHAIADAVMDSVPTVFLTGQVRTELIGTDGFQEADISGITMPIVKHSILIQDPRDIPKAIHEAFHIARSGPARAGAGGRAAGPLAGRHPLRAGEQGAPARLPAHHRGQRQADPPGRQGAGQLAPAGDLRGRRHHQRERLEGVPRAVPVGRLPGHLHADGPGRVPGRPRTVARDARHARHAHGQLRDGRGGSDRARSAPASTTASRASCPSSPRGPSSSTSTSTRPRSRRTCPPTSRSWATRRTSCRS